jgi:hypothetical protein
LTSFSKRLGLWPIKEWIRQSKRNYRHALKNDSTRQKLLERWLKGPIMAGSALTAGVVTPRSVSAGKVQKVSREGFELCQRELMRMTIDEIIPAGDGMPATSEVGGVRNLTRLAPAHAAPAAAEFLSFSTLRTGRSCNRFPSGRA